MVIMTNFLDHRSVSRKMGGDSWKPRGYIVLVPVMAGAVRIIEEYGGLNRIFVKLSWVWILVLF